MGNLRKNKIIFHLDWLLVWLLAPIVVFGHFNTTYDHITLIITYLGVFLMGIASILVAYTAYLNIKLFQSLRLPHQFHMLPLTPQKIKHFWLNVIIALALIYIDWSNIGCLMFGFATFNFVVGNIRYGILTDRPV